MRYTEGPWWVEPPDLPGAAGRDVYDGYGHTATVYGDSDVAEANARLIAAAPQLLEYLKEAALFIDHHTPFSGVSAKYRDLIAHLEDE